LDKIKQDPTLAAAVLKPGEGPGAEKSSDNEFGFGRGKKFFGKSQAQVQSMN